MTHGIKKASSYKDAFFFIGLLQALFHPSALRPDRRQ